MDKLLERCFIKAKDEELPRDLSAFSKAPDSLPAGTRIGWWYREDEKFARANGEKVEEQPPFTGVVIPRPDIENRGGGRYDSSDLIVVMDEYPAEKCDCETTYIAMRQLLDVPELVRVIELPANLRV